MKFALVDFIEQWEELPLKHNFMVKAPRKIQDIYIRRTLPCKLEEVDFSGGDGIRIGLPLKRSAAMADREKAAAIAHKVLEGAGEDIGIIALPSWFSYDPPAGIALAEKNRAMPFFIFEILTKAMHITKKTFKTAEILIIAGDRGRTDFVLDRLYPQVNFLTILCRNSGDHAYYSEKAEAIFADTGLNLQLITAAGPPVGSADFIISAGPDNARYLNWFKAGGVYVELDYSEKNRSVQAILDKRPDILAVDDLVLSLNGHKLALSVADMMFYAGCKEYRLAFEGGPRGQGRRLAQADSMVSARIKKQDIKIYGFKSAGLEIDHNRLKAFIGQLS